MIELKNKVVIAPMVRVSTLPFRLLCLDYGADFVYTEETIDFKMLRSVKEENEHLGTTDFVDKSDGTIFFRTCEREKKKLIFQIGTCNPQRALKVAKLVEDHVAGIDINMGCPKEFSLKGGMGAALLHQPEKVKEILSTLTQNVSVAVTCKIRLLPSFEETLSLCRLIESCGVAAVAIHGRTKEERPKHPNRNHIIRDIAKSLTIPVIANGGSKEIDNLNDVETFRQDTGASSVMIARAAMWNCSFLRKAGKLPQDTVITEFLKYCIQYDNPFTFTKYTIQNILRELQCTNKGKAFLEAQTLQEMCSLWGLKDYFNETMLSHSLKGTHSKSPFVNLRSCTPQTVDNIRVVEKEEDGFHIKEMPLQFIRGNFASADLPKMILNNYVFRNGLKKPKFTSDMTDKFFISSVEVDGVKYRSSVKEKSRRYSEQGAAMVCLHTLNLVGSTYGFVPSEGTRKYLNHTAMALEVPERAEKREGEIIDDVENKSQKVSSQT